MVSNQLICNRWDFYIGSFCMKELVKPLIFLCLSQISFGKYHWNKSYSAVCIYTIRYTTKHLYLLSELLCIIMKGYYKTNIYLDF